MSGTTGRVEMALAPDRATDPLSWDWTEVTDSAKVTTLAVSRGQTSGGAAEMQPGSMSFPILNPGGVFTPGRADSPHYPNLKLGTPVRAVVEGQRDPYLALTGETGSRASTPDNVALDVTGDLSVAVEFECPLRIPPTEETFFELTAKWEGTTQKSWRLLLRPDGALTLEWTTGGTSATIASFDGKLGIPRPDAGVFTIGFNLDVDNGASGRTVTWYVARGGMIVDLIADPAAYIHETQTASGTTSIFASTADLQIGDNTGAVNAPCAAKVRRMIMRSGSMAAGTIVANPIFIDQTPGATSFTDSAGRAWTVNAPASITDDQVRILGELASSIPLWPAYDKDQVAEVQWSVLGPLSRMRQGAKPIGSALYRRVTAPAILNNNVIAYWPLEDGSEATSAFSPVAGVEPMSIGGDTGWRFAADNTLISSNPLPHTDSVIAFAGQVPPYDSTHSLIQFVTRIDTFNPAASGATDVIAVETTGTVKRWKIAIDDTNVSVLGTDAFGNTVDSETGGHVLSGGWHLWSFDIRQNGGNVDWRLDITTVGGSTVLGPIDSFAGTVGTVTKVHNWLTAAPATGGISFGHIMVTTSSVTNFAYEWIFPAETAWNGEPAGRRFYRLCQENGIQGLVDGVYALDWPTARSAGAKGMGPQRPAPLLELLGECALVENARIGESRELLAALTYRTNHNAQAPALTVTSELGNPFEPTDDTQGLVNDATVTMPNSTSHRQIDQPSIDASGLYEASRQVNARTALQLPDLASWWLHESLWPDLRVPVLRIELGNNPALFGDWLALQPGDVVRITTPASYPEPTLDVLVDGYTEELSRFNWGLVLNVRPAGPWEVGVRDDADRGIRDTGGSILDAAFDAGTDTTMDVETTLGPLWAVTAASNSALPFDVDVGGARITVTAIGAVSGGVQTFTVTQTPVNGIVKTVPAGTPVRVWRPARRALMRGTT